VGSDGEGPMPRNRTSWLQPYTVILPVGLLVGAAAGALIFVLFQLNGVLAAVVAGAAAGVIGAIAVRSLAGSVSVAEVELTIPHFSKITFATTRDRRSLAYRIVNRMAASIAIQRLGENTGYAREALDSLYRLVRWLGEALDDEPGSRPPGKPNVDVLALNMLNHQLRPFLSYWHRRLGDWEKATSDGSESAWPDDARFRAELAQLQDRLRPIALGFAELAGYADYAAIIGLSPDTAPPPSQM
ncbi:MAG: hypothetical protein ACRDQB_10800, partial [Thermocrispum sp.]